MKWFGFHIFRAHPMLANVWVNMQAQEFSPVFDLFYLADLIKHSPPTIVFAINMMNNLVIVP